MEFLQRASVFDRPVMRGALLAVQLVLGLLLAAMWFVGFGFYAALSGTFGGVGGWAWAIGYFAVTGLIIAITWPFRGRRIIVAVGAVLSVIGGLLVARSVPYNAGRLEQILGHLAPPPHGQLVATVTENSCFGNCADVIRYYLVPSSSGNVETYGQTLLALHFHHADQGVVIPDAPVTYYDKGNLSVSIGEFATAYDPGWSPAGSTHIAAANIWHPDKTGEVPAPSGYDFFMVKATSTS